MKYTQGDKIKIGTPLITQPNMEGIIERETPKMLIVKITNATFENKSNNTLTHVFTNSQKEWFEIKKPLIRRFWKNTLKQVGGNNWIITNKPTL